MSKKEICNEKIDDGGPAFPSEYIPGTATTPGMSLRDWFAGQALVGLLANSAGNRELQETHWADIAFTHADAMLAARKEVRP